MITITNMSKKSNSCNRIMNINGRTNGNINNYSLNRNNCVDSNNNKPKTFIKNYFIK